MVYCPICKTEWDEDVTECPICGRELPDEENGEVEWIKLGMVPDKLSAELAKQMLEAEDIPVVVISRSGFFGEIGLTLHDFYSGQPGLFEVSVPKHLAAEASEILSGLLGDRWRPSGEDA